MSNKLAEKEPFYRKLIIILSIVIPIAVFALIMLPENLRVSDLDVSSLPLFHAILNGTTALLLIIGRMLIKRGNKGGHKMAMISAFALSCMFLVSYVTYHYVAEHSTYGGEGAIRYIYFFILITHIILSAAVVPLALFAMFRGLAGQFEKHKRVVKYAYPVWLYVAVTGVMVYLFMMPYYNF